MEIRPISEAQKKKLLEGYGEQLRKAWTHDWVFSGWEKLVIVAILAYGIYSIIKLIYGIFV